MSELELADWVMRVAEIDGLPHRDWARVRSAILEGLSNHARRTRESEQERWLGALVGGAEGNFVIPAAVTSQTFETREAAEACLLKWVEDNQP